MKQKINLMENWDTGHGIGGLYCWFQVYSEYNITETLPQFIVSSPKTLQNSAQRHHKMRTSVENLFQSKVFKTHEEDHWEIYDGTSTQKRRVDIIALDRRGRGLILDYTLRWETNDNSHGISVIEEKNSIYFPCIPYIIQRYGIT